MIRQPPTLREALAQAEAAASVKLDTEGAVRTVCLTKLQTLLPYPLVVPIWGIETRSEANEHSHWRNRQKRAKGQRGAIAAGLCRFRNRLAMIGAEVLYHGGRVVVALTRVAPRTLDTDNLAGSLKAVRDEIAAGLGVDDRHAGIEWKYRQVRGEPGVIVAVAVGGD